MKHVSAILVLLACAGMALAQTGGIAGQVTDAQTGNPIAGAVAFAKSDSGLAGQARTNERGVYVIEGLAPGRYDVGATARGHETGRYPQPVGVRAGEVTRGIDLRLRPKAQNLGAISGRVVDRVSGLPVPGALVLAVGPNGRGKARTDRHGCYTIRGLEAGRYEVGAKAKRYMAERYPRPVEVVAGQVTADINFALTPMPRKGAISGRVIDARTGRPVAGAVVVARGENGAFRSMTDRHGFYRIGGVIPGGYQVGALKRGYRPETYPRRVVVRPGEVTQGIDFSLHPLLTDSD